MSWWRCRMSSVSSFCRSSSCCRSSRCALASWSSMAAVFFSNAAADSRCADAELLDGALTAGVLGRQPIAQRLELLLHELFEGRQAFLHVVFEFAGFLEQGALPAARSACRSRASGRRRGCRGPCRCWRRRPARRRRRRGWLWALGLPSWWSPGRARLPQACRAEPRAGRARLRRRGARLRAREGVAPLRREEGARPAASRGVAFGRARKCTLLARVRARCRRRRRPR